MFLCGRTATGATWRQAPSATDLGRPDYHCPARRNPMTPVQLISAQLLSPTGHISQKRRILQTESRVKSIIYKIRTKTFKSTALERTGRQRDNLGGRYAPGGQEPCPETRAEPGLFGFIKMRRRQYQREVLAEGKKPGSNTLCFLNVAIPDLSGRIIQANQSIIWRGKCARTCWRCSDWPLRTPSVHGRRPFPSWLGW